MTDTNDTKTDGMNSNDTKESLASEKRPRAQEPSTAAPKKRRKKLSPQVLNVRRRIQQCCKLNDLATAMEVYDEAIANNTDIEAQTFYSLLNLCDGLQEKRVHVGTPKPYNNNDNKKTNEEEQVIEVRTVDNEMRQEYAFRIKKHMDELKLALNETAYTALIRILSKAKRLEQAETLLLEAETVQQCKPRVRLYSSLLCAYCEHGEMLKALSLWSRLDKKKLVLTEREYAALIQCATIVGDASIMERVLSDLAEDVLVPSRDTTRVISEWFASPHAVVPGNCQETNTAASPKADCQSPQHSTELPCSDAPNMGPVQCRGTGWIATSGVTVDTTTGILTSGCLEGESLRPVALSNKQWNEMKEMNETIVLNGMLENDKSLYQGGGKGPKRQGKGGAEKRLSHWKDFTGYLEKHKQFDVVIDGANVGYYKQNFPGSPKHVDYRQIDSLLCHFAAEKKSVLLVMHERHFFKKFMPSWAVPIVESWKNVLYQTPSGMNDDWFWMHAALWSGRETLVVTNDEMRDHFFQMLAPRSFLRWKERHQIHFNFGEWKDGKRAVELTYPERYSRRIQRVANNGLVVPLPKRGDEHRYLDGAHVADDDHPEEETYLCIRPK